MVAGDVSSFNIQRHKMHPDPEIFYRRRLPHYQPPNETFHVTFRLADSLPVDTILRLKQEHEGIKKSIQKVKSISERMRLRREAGAWYSERYDTLLDRVTRGPSWLTEESVASKVGETIRAQDGRQYDLLAYCLMPNHVHLLATFWQLATNAQAADVERSSDRYGVEFRKTVGFDERTEVRFTSGRYIVTDALKTIKGVNARECNRLLNRHGAFWQHESYDHVLRNAAELEGTIWYVLNNPVKAGLCRHWREWKWSYVKEGLIDPKDEIHFDLTS